MFLIILDPCEDPSIELMCNNGRCVYQILQCDGLDSCGDGTDELTTAPSFCDGTMSDPIVTSGKILGFASHDDRELTHVE